MNLSDDVFLLRDLVGSVVLVPLDPVAPHLDDLVLVELTGDAETGNSMDVRVKGFALAEFRVFFAESVHNFLHRMNHINCYLLFSNFFDTWFKKASEKYFLVRFTELEYFDLNIRRHFLSCRITIIN